MEATILNTQDILEQAGHPREKSKTF